MTPAAQLARAAATDDWAALERFLILGSDVGTYQAGEAQLTRETAVAVERCLALDGTRTVAAIVTVTASGRAPKREPALFALALAAASDDDAARRAALEALPQVAATSAQLFEFVGFVEELRGWGRALRRAVGAWYASRPVDSLALDAVIDLRGADRGHRDLLRLSHPGERVSARNPTMTVSDMHRRLFEWIMRGGETTGLPPVVEGYVAAQSAADAAAAAALVRRYRLPREAVRCEHADGPSVWEALLESMTVAELLPALATIARAGLLGDGASPGTPALARVLALLGDTAAVAASGIHPLAVLSARQCYLAAGDPLPPLVDALDGAVRAATDALRPIGRRILLALDVSGSMGIGRVAGLPGLTPRDAAAALALVTAASEPHCEIAGFFAGAGGWCAAQEGRFDGRSDGLTPLPIIAGMTLEEAVAAVSEQPYGGTDPALPMRYAQATGREIDTFVVCADSRHRKGEESGGPARALREYRAASGIDARLIVVGMVSSGLPVADPSDPGMLDVVGFDAAAPRLIADFARGEI